MLADMDEYGNFWGYSPSSTLADNFRPMTSYCDFITNSKLEETEKKILKFIPFDKSILQLNVAVAELVAMDIQLMFLTPTAIKAEAKYEKREQIMHMHRVQYFIIECRFLHLISGRVKAEVEASKVRDVTKLESEVRSSWSKRFSQRLSRLGKTEAEIKKMEQTQRNLVDRFIVKLKVLLRAGTIDAEVVERMYNAEVEDMLLKAEVKEGVTAQQEAQMVAVCLQLYAVVVSAVSLLLIVYQYLMGHLDKGGTLTCSSGSFQFRATFVSIVLFEGAYVWIKSRDVTSTSIRGVYRRPGKDKPESRYRPPRQSGKYIYLGMCADDYEAEIKWKIAASYYGDHESRLDLGYGRYFHIPLMPREQEQSLSVTGKRVWVKNKVREVYEEFRKERAIRTSVVHLDRQINPSVAFDNDFRIEDVQDFCPEITFPDIREPEPLRDLPDQQPFEGTQVLGGPAIGALTSGDLTSGDHQCALHSEPAGTEGIASGEILHVLPEMTVDAPVTSNGLVQPPRIFDGSAQHDSEASKFPTTSSILSPRQAGSDAEAVLMDMVTELQQMVKDRDQRLQEWWQMMQAKDQTIQAMKQAIQEKDQTNQSLKQMIEARDRKISELELENLRLRRT